jgi:hypothetical protein
MALVASSVAPASAADWTNRTVGDSIMLGISCPTASRCVAGGAGNTILSTDNPTAGASGWNSVNVGAGEQGSYFSPSRQIRAVDCPAAGFCVGVSYEGLIYTSTNPAGGAGAWTVTQLAPSLNLRGISCPSTAFCAIGATHGQILTSTNPFAPPPPEPKAKPKKKKRKHKGPKRPRAIIATSPPPAVEIAKGKAKVRYRFFAAKHASVRGYVCKLDDHKYKPCKSPKTYRIGYGKHIFKVRAVGWTGHRGKAAYDPLEVCHPTRIGFCVKG